MSRLLSGTLAMLAVALTVACSDMTNSGSPFAANTPMASASGSGGGTGGGGGGGGGTGGGAARPCAILTFNVVNNTVLSSSVAPYWQPNTTYGGQVVGSTEKSCDTIAGAVMTWSDITGTNDGCDATFPVFVGSTYAKYGFKPMSRFDQYFFYYTGDHCIGTVRTIKAILTDQSTGTVLSTMTATWTVG